MPSSMLLSPVEAVSDVGAAGFDGVVVVATKLSAISKQELRDPLQKVAAVDAAAEKGVFVVPTPEGSPIKATRIIFSSTGPMDKDYDDVRSFALAADKGVSRALSAGCRSPLLVFVSNNDKRFPEADTVAILGAMKALYVPLETREAITAKAKKADKLGVMLEGGSSLINSSKLDLAKALEEGRIVCRDIGGSDPERMASPRVEEYVRSLFPADSGVNVEVVQGQATFEKEYPCLAAVNRAASVIPRHDGRVLWLTYEPQGGNVDKTFILVGKGITYDTGGADIKAGGIMAGMSRDKCGAASVAGILKAISILKPKNVKVIGAMAMVRNSVGENCYVSDEIITSRAGVRIRVGNTDAEGRMAMVDVLCHAKEKALKEKNPHLMTLATLTGHEVVAYGPYSAVMDNGPARRDKVAQAVQEKGDLFGDMFEVSTMRKEDYDFIKDKSGEFVDVLQCNNAASSRTPRGHQFPGAFMEVVSGIDKHMTTSEKPLRYSHLDIAGSSGSLPDPTTGSSVVAVVMTAITK